jgi:hypothetical protein
MATLNKNIEPIHLPRGNTPKPGIITPKSGDLREVITERTEDILKSPANESVTDVLT